MAQLTLILTALAGMGLGWGLRRFRQQATERLLADARIVLVEVDREGKLVRLSPSWERFTGYRVAESLGRSYREFMHPEDRLVAEVMDTAARQGLVNDLLGTGRAIAKDQSLRYFEARGATRRLPDGTYDGLVVSLSEVTGRRTPERQLRTALNRNRRLFEAIGLGFFRCTPNGEILEANQALVSMLGYASSKDLVCKNLFGDIFGRNNERARALTAPRGDAHDRWHYAQWLRANGTAIQVSVATTLLRNATGLVESLTGVATNVTERLEREERERRGERAVVLGRTLAGFAHELNNPLTSIVGNAEILLRSNPSLDARRAASAILQEARRASQLARDVLTVARREVTEDPEDVDLNGAVGLALSTCKSVFAEHSITVSSALAADLGAVFAVPSQIDRVITGLLRSAAQFASSAAAHGDTPNLQVETQGTAEHVTLAVATNGAAVSPSTLRRIWDPFGTFLDETDASGFELAVVHSLVTQQGGHLSAESPDRGGAILRVTWPVVPPRQTVAQPRKAGEQRPLDVLVVEDEGSVRDMLCRFLGLRGHAVVSAESCEQALRLIEMSAFDAVITDLHMPGCSGLQVLQTITSGRRACRTVLVTGDSECSAEVRAGAARSGAIILQKPYDLEELTRFIELPPA